MSGGDHNNEAADPFLLGYAEGFADAMRGASPRVTTGAVWLNPDGTTVDVATLPATTACARGEVSS